MKEYMPIDPIREMRSRLPYIVQGYLSMEEAKREDGIDDNTKTRLSLSQASILDNMTLEEKGLLYKFGQERERIIGEVKYE